MFYIGAYVPLRNDNRAGPGDASCGMVEEEGEQWRY
jgi:hypothetical protein